MVRVRLWGGGEFGVWGLSFRSLGCRGSGFRSLAFGFLGLWSSCFSALL